MKYIPLTDEQLEKNVLERIDVALDALSALNAEHIPDKLLNALEEVVEEWGEWEQIVLEDDYQIYLDAVDDMAMEHYYEEKFK